MPQDRLAIIAVSEAEPIGPAACPLISEVLTVMLVDASGTMPCRQFDDRRGFNDYESFRRPWLHGLHCFDHAVAVAAVVGRIDLPADPMKLQVAVEIAIEQPLGDGVAGSSQAS